MTFVDHLKGNNPEKLLLEVAFGRHVVQGDLAKSIVTGVSPTHIVTVQQLLGEAFGKGWGSVVGAWFRGTNRDSTKYKFHPGFQSLGNSDADQGIDSVFDQDTPHSNAAWIRVECPNGSEVGIPDFDTKNNPPVGFEGIFRCQTGDIYDASGDVDGSDLLVNPADVLAFGCRVIREFPSSRIDWASLDVLRAACAAMVTPDYTTLPQGVGLTGSYYDGSAFGSFKSKRVDPVIEYDLSSGAPALDLTPTGFSVRWEGKIRFKYSETYTMTLVHNDSGKLWIEDMTTPIIDQAAAGTHTGTFTPVADEWFDIKIEWTNAAGDSEFALKWNSTSQPLQVVPQDRLYPKNEDVPRFECHMKFVQPTTFEDFLQSVLLTCNGAYQDIDGELRFFIIDDQDTVFDFDETNIVKDTLEFRPRFSKLDERKLANRYTADGRDLDNRYLQAFDPPLNYDVTDSQEKTLKIIEQAVNLGNVRRWQGLENMRHYAKLHGQGMIATFEGTPKTLAVLPGDKVFVSHPRTGWTDKQFLVLEATDKSHDSSPANRIFKLLEWGGCNALAVAFNEIAGITDVRTKSAICQLVADWDAAKIRSKIRAFWPYVGGSAASTKFNLMDPRDADDAFRITWHGGVTHDLNGVTGDGSTGYGDTHFNPQAEQTGGDTTIGAYSRTAGQEDRRVMGAWGLNTPLIRYEMRTRGSDDLFAVSMYNDGTAGGPLTLAVTTSTGAGLFIGTRRSLSDFETYINGASVASSTSGPVDGTLPNVNIYVLANNLEGTGATLFSSRNLASQFIADGLTSAEVRAFSLAVHRFETTMGRAV